MQDQQTYALLGFSISSIILIVLAMSPVIPDARVEMVTALLSTYVVKFRYSCYFTGTTAFTRSERKMVNDMALVAFLSGTVQESVYFSI